MSDGAELIAAERLRQVTAEGWTPEHDAEHTDGSMVRAAVCYASYGQKASAPYPLWPWADSWWKPSDDPIKNLVRAGALIAAEIDRIDGTTPTEPADELARLRAWKAEAMELLGVWDQVHDALGSPAKLGQSKATASLAATQRLVAPTEAATSGLEPGEIVAAAPPERGWEIHEPPPFCVRCDGYGVVLPVGSSIAATCPACNGNTASRPERGPKAEPAAAPQVDLEDARRLADDGLEPFDLRRCIRRLADELDAHRAMRAELVALVAEVRNEATAAPKAATRVAVWKYHDRLARILGEQP